MYMKQKLRFENVLKDYVRDLSFGTTNIKKLVAECEDFPKLREPLFLYAKFNGKLKLLTGSRCLSLSAAITASAWNSCLQHVSNPMVASR